MRAVETIVILNPGAGGGAATSRWRRHAAIVESRLGRARVVETDSARAATLRTREALRAGARHVVAVGGDGTVNGVVNGFFDAETGAAVSDAAVLVVLPVGTGNDFARSIGLHGAAVSPALERSRVRRIDVGALTVTDADGGPSRRVFFANTATFGTSARIAAEVGASAKRLGGSLAYWVGTARVLLTERAARVRLRLDDEEQEAVVSMVAVGNGRYVGGGMKITPHACVDDGWLDVVCVDGVSLAQFVRHSRRLYAGTHVELPFVRATRVRRLEAELVNGAGRRVPADTEGELAGVLPLACEVRSAALNVLAPWSDAEACAPETRDGERDRV